MKNFILVYIIVQLISTAYGLAVIESIKPVVKPKNEYDSKNKNSLYNYSSTYKDILRGFIPFYYFVKALSLLTTTKKEVKEEEINETNKYLRSDNASEVTVIDEPDTDFSIYRGKFTMDEKPERYTARKNDISMFDDEETPIEYITRQTEEKPVIEDKNLELTPFLGGNHVTNHVVIKDEVTKSDIAKAISELDSDELKALSEKLTQLSELKKRNISLRLEKDAA